MWNVLYALTNSQIFTYFKPNVRLSSAWWSLNNCKLFSQRHLYSPVLGVI